MQVAPEEEYFVMENQGVVTVILYLQFYLRARAGAQLGAVGSLLQQCWGFPIYCTHTGQLSFGLWSPDLGLVQGFLLLGVFGGTDLARVRLAWELL